MRISLKQIVTSMFFTILVLIALEIVSTTLLPAIGIINYKFAFNILIILYLGFKLDTPALAILIFLIQCFHGAFSVEGWAHGTFVGVLVCIIMGYTKDLIHLSSPLTTMILTQIFQVIWFLLLSLLHYIQFNNLHYIKENFLHFIVESIVISILSPFFFSFLDRIWPTQTGDGLGVS